jgi:hypothetical protein
MAIDSGELCALEGGKMEKWRVYFGVGSDLRVLNKRVMMSVIYEVILKRRIKKPL